MQKYKENEIVTIRLERYEEMKEEIEYLTLHNKEKETWIGIITEERDEQTKTTNKYEKIIKEILKKNDLKYDSHYKIKEFQEYGYKNVINEYDEEFKETLKELAIAAFCEMYKEKEQEEVDE